MTDVLWRIQDREGRGPFKPGMSDTWLDDKGHSLPPFYIELGIEPHEIAFMVTPGFHAGCACRSRDDLHKWFSRTERRRLKRMGYFEVSFSPDRIIVETPTQVVFENAFPLAGLLT